LDKYFGKFGKYSRKLGKILWKIRKNIPQNQDPGVKITFSNYVYRSQGENKVFNMLLNPVFRQGWQTD